MKTMSGEEVDKNEPSEPKNNGKISEPVIQDHKTSEPVTLDNKTSEPKNNVTSEPATVDNKTSEPVTLDNKTSEPKNNGKISEPVTLDNKTSEPKNNGKISEPATVDNKTSEPKNEIRKSESMSDRSTSTHRKERMQRRSTRKISKGSSNTKSLKTSGRFSRHDNVSSSTSSEDEGLDPPSTYTNTPTSECSSTRAKRKKKPITMPKKLVDLQQAVAIKKEQIVERAEPTVTRIYVALTPYKDALIERVDPWLNRIEERLDPYLVRANIFLHGVILKTQEQVKEVEVWLEGTAPDGVWDFFAPVPLDEKEPFKIHKPTGLSMCFFALNIALTIVGLWIFLIGVFAVINPSVFKSMTNFDPTERFKHTDFADLLGSWVYLIILFGAFVLWLGYLGVIGCILGQRQMLKAYAVIVGLFIGGQGVTLLLSFYNRENIYYSLAESLQKDVKNEYDGTRNSTSAFSQLVDLVHFSLSCCGVLNYTDFVGSPWYREANKPRNGSKSNVTFVHQFPISCCKALGDSVAETRSQLANGDCLEKPPSLKNEYTAKPCLEALVKRIKRGIFYILGFLSSFVGLEITAISNAMAIVKTIDKTFAKRRKMREKMKKREADELAAEERSQDRPSKKRARRQKADQPPGDAQKSEQSSFLDYFRKKSSSAVSFQTFNAKTTPDPTPSSQTLHHTSPSTPPATPVPADDGTSVDSTAPNCLSNVDLPTEMILPIADTVDQVPDFTPAPSDQLQQDDTRVTEEGQARIPESRELPQYLREAWNQEPFDNVAGGCVDGAADGAEEGASEAGVASADQPAVRPERFDL